MIRWLVFDRRVMYYMEELSGPLSGKEGKGEMVVNRNRCWNPL